MNLLERVKNRFDVSQILRDLVLRLAKLEKTIKTIKLNENIYSQQETIIGKWIDNSYVYRKVFIIDEQFMLDNSLTNFSLYLPNFIPNYKQIITCSIYFYSPGGAGGWWLGNNKNYNVNIKIFGDSIMLTDTEEQAILMSNFLIAPSTPENPSIDKLTVVVEYIKNN